MLLDEALAGLTPSELQRAIALVRQIHEIGITLVIVEHIMEVIMTLAAACDRVQPGSCDRARRSRKTSSRTRP